MGVDNTRKRKHSTLLYNRSHVFGYGTVKKKNGFTVFLLYDRQSTKDRDLVTRLGSTLQERGIKTSPFYDGTNGFILKAYEDKLEAADKVVAVLSPNFMKSDESMYIFEMARNMCMDIGENNIIVCSRSRRNLPPAFNSFPRVKMTDKDWIDRLVKGIGTPGERRVNVEDLTLYKECERNSSISMPSLSCLLHPPTLPKYIADSFMIWSKISKRPCSKRGLDRRTSERLQRQADNTGTSVVRKASSFNKDRETAEFVSKTCSSYGTILKSKETSNSYSSNLCVKDNLPEMSRLGKPKVPCSSQLQHDDPENNQAYKKLKIECLNPSRKSSIRRYWKIKKRWTNVKKRASFENALLVGNNKHADWYKPLDIINSANNFQGGFSSHSSDDSKLTSKTIPLLKDTNMPRHEILSCGCLDSVSDVTFFDPKKVHLSDRTIRQPVSTNAEPQGLNPQLKPRRQLRRSNVLQVPSESEAEFDRALQSKPEHFRIVNFAQVQRGFSVSRDEIVWLYSTCTIRDGNRTSMLARKRNGDRGRISKLLLRLYINPENG